MSRGLVLAAHGSRRNPEANALVRRLAESVRARRAFDEVAVAFHQGEPRFDAVLDELTARQIVVVPLLTSDGYYADVVLPQALASNGRFREVRLGQTPPVGTSPRLAALVARRVAELLRSQAIPRRAISLAIIGHGTQQHPASRCSTLELAETLRRHRVAGEVMAAFIDDEPQIETVLKRASHPYLIVVPFLIGGSTHVSEDIPRRLSAGGQDRRIIVDRPVGAYPELVDVVLDLARRYAPSPLLPAPSRHSAPRPVGGVRLVGAGPGDPGLITVRGLELLRAADVVVHDRLISHELLAEAGPATLLIDVGKAPGQQRYSQDAISALLVEHARAGKVVVRLKGGDPFVFGRGSEELEACRLAGISVEVVPGISSAIAAPAAAGIPVTARGVASAFSVETGHTAAPPVGPATLVLLMGRESLREIAQRLMDEGRDPLTPAACIQAATTSEQRVVRATLAGIADAADQEGMEAPVVTVVGAVAALGHDAECCMLAERAAAAGPAA